MSTSSHSIVSRPLYSPCMKGNRRSYVYVLYMRDMGNHINDIVYSLFTSENNARLYIHTIHTTPTYTYLRILHRRYIDVTIRWPSPRLLSILPFMLHPILYCTVLCCTCTVRNNSYRLSRGKFSHLASLNQTILIPPATHACLHICLYHAGRLLHITIQFDRILKYRALFRPSVCLFGIVTRL